MTARCETCGRKLRRYEGKVCSVCLGRLHKALAANAKKSAALRAAS